MSAPPSTDVFADIRARFEAAGQAHVFQWYDEGRLTAEEAASLHEQLAPMNLDRIAHLFRETMAAKIAGISEDSIKPVAKSDNLGKIPKDKVEAWHTLGLRAIAAGEVSRQFHVHVGDLLRGYTDATARATFGTI